MPYRNNTISVDNLYHIYNKSIAGYKIFNYDEDYERMIWEIKYYSLKETPCKFSRFMKFHKAKEMSLKEGDRIVEIIAYCIMPTHIHFILTPLVENGISKFMNLILQSYSKYFNLKHDRKGPLWEGRFKDILIDSDEYLLHLTRYIHLNPVTAKLVERAEDWEFSSYREFLNITDKDKKICKFSPYLDIKPASYKKFVDDQKDYQRALAEIKRLILE